MSVRSESLGMEPARCKRYGDGVGYLVCCACAGSSVASSTDIPIEGCLDKSGGVTVDMLECIGLEAERQDKQLNRNYKALMGDLSEARKKQLQAASGKLRSVYGLNTVMRTAIFVRTLKAAARRRPLPPTVSCKAV